MSMVSESNRLLDESRDDELVDNSDNSGGAGTSHVVAVSSDANSNGCSYCVNIMKSCFNTFAHMLVGSSTIVTMWYVSKRDQFSAYEQHIVFSVVGYQLLMAQAMLVLSPVNSWSSSMRLLHRRRVHWILQLIGSVFAIAGSAIMIRQKTVHFNTVHSKLALAAMVFTCISLVNGMTSLYSTELRRYVSPNFSKIGHICLGTTAFILSSVCLCFGYNKGSFKEWASDEFAYLMMGITAMYTLITVATPCSTLFRKVSNLVKNKLF